MFRSLLIIALASLVLIAGCQSQPERPASHIHEYAHTGGSFLAISPDSRSMASGGWSGGIKRWDLATGTELAHWKGHTDSVNGLLFLADGGLISAGYDGLMAQWTSKGAKRQSWNTVPVTAFAGDLEQGLMLTGHNDGSVRLWSLDGKELAAWQVFDSRAGAVALEDGPRMAASSRGRRVAIWSLSTKPTQFERPSSWSRTLAFSPDGQWLYGAGWFDLYRWNLGDGDQGPGNLEVLDTDHRGIINSIQFTPDGQIASISRQTDSSVLLLDPATGSTNQRLQKHELCGVAVRVSGDGRFVTTTSDDASVRIWDLHQAE